MMFGQLSNRESLRDIVVALEAHHSKCKFLGIESKPIAKNTFSSANQNRNYRLFEDFAFYMMKEACEKRATYEILQILNISLTDKTHLTDLFDNTKFNNVKELDNSLHPGAIRLIFNSSQF
nr:DUF4372 domain-containing protein [Segatella buccae]